MVRAVVVYESIFGNTKDVARAIAEGLSAHLPVETVEVGAAPTSLTEDVVLVVGGPTHAFGMSRPETRQDAAASATAPVSQTQGVREWLKRITISGHPSVATFDTKVTRPRLPGSAGHAIERSLQGKGCRILRPAETFLVHGKTGPLAGGEVQRARAFGRELGALAVSDAHGRTARGPATADPQEATPRGLAIGDQTRTQSPAGRPARRTTRHTLLAALAGFMAIGATAGGLGLMNGAEDFFGEQTATIYARLPFESPQFAGAALLLGVAVPMALTAVLAWRGSRLTAAVGGAAGAVLVGWIIVQLALIGTFFWLQPVCLAWGLAVTVLALNLDRPAVASTRHSNPDLAHRGPWPTVATTRHTPSRTSPRKGDPR